MGFWAATNNKTNKMSHWIDRVEAFMVGTAPLDLSPSDIASIQRHIASVIHVHDWKLAERLQAGLEAWRLCKRVPAMAEQRVTDGDMCIEDKLRVLRVMASFGGLHTPAHPNSVVHRFVPLMSAVAQPKRSVHARVAKVPMVLWRHIVGFLPRQALVPSLLVLHQVCSGFRHMIQGGDMLTKRCLYASNIRSASDLVHLNPSALHMVESKCSTSISKRALEVLPRLAVLELDDNTYTCYKWVPGLCALRHLMYDTRHGLLQGCFLTQLESLHCRQAIAGINDLDMFPHMRSLRCCALGTIVTDVFRFPQLCELKITTNISLESHSILLRSLSQLTLLHVKVNSRVRASSNGHCAQLQQHYTGARLRVLDLTIRHTEDQQNHQLPHTQPIPKWDQLIPLESCASLRSLHLNHCIRFNDDMVRQLTNLTALELSWRCTHDFEPATLTPTCLQPLRLLQVCSFTELKHSDRIRQLPTILQSALRCPALRCLGIHARMPSGFELPIPTTVYDLDLASSSNLQDAMFRYCAHVTALSLRHCSRSPSASAGALTPMLALKELDVCNCTVDVLSPEFLRTAVPTLRMLNTHCYTPWPLKTSPSVTRLLPWLTHLTSLHVDHTVLPAAAYRTLRKRGVTLHLRARRGLPTYGSGLSLTDRFKQEARILKQRQAFYSFAGVRMA